MLNTCENTNYSNYINKLVHKHVTRDKPSAKSVLSVLNVENNHEEHELCEHNHRYNKYKHERALTSLTFRV